MKFSVIEDHFLRFIKARVRMIGQKRKEKRKKGGNVQFPRT